MFENSSHNRKVNRCIRDFMCKLFNLCIDVNEWFIKNAVVQMDKVKRRYENSSGVTLRDAWRSFEVNNEKFMTKALREKKAVCQR